MFGSNRGHSIIEYISTGGTIPRTAQLSYDLLVKTTVYALCVALVFVLLIGVGSAAKNNTAPVLDPIGDRSVDENTELSFTISASDDDGDTLAYSAIDLPSGAILNSLSGLFAWTPSFDQAGIYSVQFNVTDGTEIDYEVVTITVGAVNRPPVATDDTDTTSEDTPVTTDVLINDSDPDGDALTVTTVTNPTNGAVVINGGTTVTYTPNENFNGADSYTYTISDGNWGTDTATVTITVDATNDAPIANDDSDSTSEDTPITTDVLANDSDPDGDALTVTTVTNPTNGAAVINADNTVTYTPNTNFNGIDTYIYTISDGNLGTDTATVTISIGSTNDAPIATDDSDSTFEDTPVTTDVLSNDSDPEGDTLTVTAVTSPANGAAVINADNTVTYTPNTNFNGIDTYIYTISDGNLGTDTATVTISIGSTNDAPIATDDSDSTSEDTSVTTDVLTNDSDPDGDALTVTTVTSPANGAAVINGGTTVTYTPNGNFNGADSYTYTISDGNGGTDTATVTITVGATNDAPIATDDSDSTSEDTPVITTVLSNDSDPEGDTLTVTAVTSPANGAAVINADNTVTYTPNGNFNGADSYTYTISDGNLGTDTATVTISIGSTNDAPVLDYIGPKSVDENTELSFTVSASDDDGDTLRYSAVGLPTGASFDHSSGLFTWTPTYNQEGNYLVQFKVTDEIDNDLESVTITVGSVNRAPVLDPIGDQSVDENTELSFTVSASDGDGDTLTYSAVGLPTGASLDHSSGLFEWTPTYDQEGTYSVQFKVTDGTDSDSETVTITVNGVNRPPLLDPIGDQSVDENTELSFTVSASDDDGETLKYSAVGLPTGATLISSTTGSFKWTPTYDQEGIYSVQFKVTDGKDIDFEIVTITVNDVNRAPTLDPIGQKSVNENTTLSFTVSAADEDDEDTLTYSAVGLPTGATLNSSNGLFAWTPTYEQAGPHSVQFNVTDGKYIDFEIVTITVNDVNRAPILDSITGIQINETETATIVLSASDPDDNTITYSTNATFGVLTNNTFTWISGYDDYGIYYLEFTVSDDDLTDTDIGVIVVGDADRAPVLDHIGPKSVNEKSILSFILNASDADGDKLEYSAVDLPTGATFNSSTRVFKWTPADDQSGIYHVNFEVTDGLLQDSENVTITVNDVNTDTTQSSSGGGGGGGGGSTGEEFDNIEVRDVIRAYINKDSTITYEFKEELNAIDFVRFDAKISAGYIAATIEVLKDTSALVSTSPSGEVYQNMNIWVGNAGYATEEKITNPIIEFKVARSWITENNIDISNIHLCRYSSGVWDTLPTTKKNEDEKYIYFTSKTPGFSPFAITAIQRSNTFIPSMLSENTPAAYFTTPSTSTDDMTNSDEMKGKIEVPHEETKSSRGLIILLSSIGIIAIIITLYLRRDSSWDMP